MQVGHNQGQKSSIEKYDHEPSCSLGGCPNYYRNSFHGPEVTNPDRHLEHATFESGMAARHEANEDDNYSQPRIFYQVKIYNQSTRLLFPFARNEMQYSHHFSSRKYWMIVEEPI